MTGVFQGVGLDFSVADTVTLARARTALERLSCPQRFLLFTCNRSEAFCWTDGSTVSSDQLPSARRTSGTEALTRLFRIAAGLESMVFGEYQILGQVKDSYAQARDAGTLGKELDRILRDALSCAKRVRTELDLGAVPPSVCRAGLDALESFGGVRGKRVFIIGSGRTGSLAAQLARERGAATLTVCNRSPERTAHLVRDYGAQAVDYNDRAATIAASDVVISATASPHVVVPRETLALTHPVLFLDLATPRDIEPSVADLPLATLVSLDTMGALARGDHAERERLTARAEAIISDSVAETQAWLEGLS